MFQKIILVMVLSFACAQSMALETLVSKPTGNAKGLVIIAPAKKYLMRERLFSKLAESLANEGYIVVRFNWSANTLEVPELEFQRASHDIQNVVLASQKTFGFSSENTILISKSFSTKALELSLSLAQAQILLTPNCSVEAPFQKTYWNVLNQVGLSLKLIISNEDPYCNVDEIRESLKNLHKLNLLTTTIQGDHNFVITKPESNESSYKYQDLVIKNIVEHLVK